MFHDVPARRFLHANRFNPARNRAGRRSLAGHSSWGRLSLDSACLRPDRRSRSVSAAGRSYRMCQSHDILGGAGSKTAKTAARSNARQLRDGPTCFSAQACFCDINRGRGGGGHPSAYRPHLWRDIPRRYSVRCPVGRRACRNRGDYFPEKTPRVRIAFRGGLGVRASIQSSLLPLSHASVSHAGVLLCRSAIRADINHGRSRPSKFHGQDLAQPPAARAFT